MARPAKWKSPTESVRLPAHAIEQCLKLAQMLDLSTAQAPDQGFVQNLDPILVSILKGSKESKFLIQPEPLTLAEQQQVEELLDSLIADMDQAGFNRGDRLLVFAGLVEAWGKPL